MYLLEGLAKAFFAKKCYWMINLFTMQSMKKVGKYTNVGHKSDTEAIDKVLSDRKGLSYFELLEQVLYNDTMI